MKREIICREYDSTFLTFNRLYVGGVNIFLEIGLTELLESL